MIEKFQLAYRPYHSTEREQLFQSIQAKIYHCYTEQFQLINDNALHITHIGPTRNLLIIIS